MANQRKPEPNKSVKESPINLLLTGAICLGIGLGIGYYFGKQNAEVSVSSALAPSQGQTSTPSQGQAPVQDPAVFIQNEASLKAALSAEPTNLQTLIQLGNLYYDNNRFQQAIDWYGKALEIDPRNVNVRTDRGTSYWNLNQPDAAIAEFKKSLEVDPGHAQTLYNLGVVYLHGKNDIKEAKETWRKLLEKNPNYPDRAKVEEQLASMGASSMPGTVPEVQKKPGSSGTDDLFDRMKSRP